MTERFELTRKELYEQIWTETLSKVAAKYQVSFPRLKNICERYQIPLPDNRYWGRLNTGQNPKRNELPDLDENIRITFYTSATDDQLFVKFLNEEERDKINEVYNNLKVGRQLREPHDLIKKVDLTSVSKENERRALIFLDALFKAVEKIGGAICNEPFMYFLIADIKVGFRIRERHHKIHTGKKDKYGNGYVWKPSGILLFNICNGPVESVVMSEFEETDKKSLADIIQRIFLNIIKLAFRHKERSEEIAEALRREEEARLGREVDRLMHEKELNRTRGLIAEAQRFRIAEDIRAYVLAIERNMSVSKEAPMGKTTDWVAWARHKADWLDPIVNNSDEILDLADVEKVFCGT
ncbi:hypothetical protein SAMN02745823_03802 [Sporobacter termitidis DSM 10068]|uniref:Uncharacterized protein n=1 Tax=Sporobacter termitidis DSM 10068 TaxID=1123282 RepID=A0A1M5ZIR0_9FIRM|nr:hypothetical protein [Sporobacter termitidis]SHI24120.1 hypothetical protein SAMN02745823_03802 [Sporobacter termitidis DSM 10068]